MVASNPTLWAQTAGLKPVPPALVPKGGTFYSLQKTNWPPLPFAPPGLPVYALGDGVFALDDTLVVYPVQSAPAALSPQPGGGNAPLGGGPPPNAGCGLWLSVSRTSSNAVILTLHNTVVGHQYEILSTETVAPANWLPETNLTASSNLAETLIYMRQRPNLFLLASTPRDYVTNLLFRGLVYTNTLRNPPDTMGAVGPDHFVELLNAGSTGATAIAVYDKSGNMLECTNSLGFFALHDADGTNYPTGLPVDNRILYDQQSQRWVACTIDPVSSANQASGQAILAVSNGGTPTNLASGWTRYLVRVHREGQETDFATLGLDGNGVYLRVLHTASGVLAGHTVVAIKKPELYQGTFVAKQFDITNGPPVWTVQPAFNFDAVPASGYAWFVGKGPAEYGTRDGTNYYDGGAILYRRLHWEGTNAYLDADWFTASGTGYRDYYDLDGTNATVVASTGIAAPEAEAEGGLPVSLWEVGSRLQTAVIRNGFLWTSQAVGVTGTNGSYPATSGAYTGTNVDRAAIQWLKLQVGVDGSSLTLGGHGRVFDRLHVTNAWWYYFPSLTVNCAGDMAVGFSGSSAASYGGAFYACRPALGAGMSEPRLLRAGEVPFTIDHRWGDYSATSVDPADDWSFWTVQQYAAPTNAPFGSYPWETVVARIRRDP